MKNLGIPRKWDRTVEKYNKIYTEFEKKYLDLNDSNEEDVWNKMSTQKEEEQNMYMGKCKYK